MISTLYAKLIAAGFVLALIIGAYAWAHHNGAVSQKAADAVKLTAAATALGNARDQLRIDSTTFATLNANAMQESDAAKAEQAKGVAAVALSQKAAKQAAIDAAAWQLKFNRAAISKPCATVLQQQVCAAVFR